MLRVVRIMDDLCEYLPKVKRYAGVNDNSQDDILIDCIKSAIIGIQEQSGRSIARCECILDVSSNQEKKIPLYGCVDEILDVIPGVDFSLTGNKLSIGSAIPELSIHYTTIPSEGEKARLMTSVIMYAVALYDGATEELPKILAQC